MPRALWFPQQPLRGTVLLVNKPIFKNRIEAHALIPEGRKIPGHGRPGQGPPALIVFAGVWSVACREGMNERER